MRPLLADPPVPAETAVALPAEAGTAHERPARHERIAVAAYRRAEQRGFEAGAELDDWLQAEREIDAEDAKND